MRWVRQMAHRPHRCAVIPYLGNSTGRKGFIDAGVELPGWDPHVYVSVEAVEQMARMIGWQPALVREETDRRLEERAGRIEALKARVAELEAELEAVAVLKNSRFVQQGAPGRPRKVAA